MKDPCNKCGAEIFSSSFENVDGICNACKQALLHKIEIAEQIYQEQKKSYIFRNLWRYLVYRVYVTDDGYNGLSHYEKVYFSVSVFEGECKNGGIERFFSNSYDKLYNDVVTGLMLLEANQTLKLLLKAKDILFGEVEPFEDDKNRWDATEKLPEDNFASFAGWEIELEDINNAIGKDPDKFREKLKSFAVEKKLVDSFIV